MNAVDTNILVYAVDADEPEKCRKARDFLRQLGQSEPPCLMWQVAGELLACLRRWEERRGFDSTTTRRYFELISGNMQLVMPSPDVANVSFDLIRRFSLSHWDSMLVAACIQSGIEILYSEDLQDGMTYDSVTVHNPLKDHQA